MSDHQAQSATGDLRVGLAKVEITPPIGQPLGGFLDRLKINNGAATQLHDPLYARVCVLQVGKVSVAIVTLDLLFFLSRRINKIACDRWNLSQVLVSCTHTHAGPIPSTSSMIQWSNLDVDPEEVLDFKAFYDDPWFAQTEEKIIEAIGLARQNLFDARLAVGSGSLGDLYLAHNRRLVDAQGKVKMLWANPPRLPTQPLDNTLRVIRIEDHSGNPRALLTHFACHPVVLGGKNLAISADFPGALIAHVEREMGDNCMGMFLQGAEGDIDPCDMNLFGQEGHAVAQAIGQSLGAVALAISKANSVDTRSQSKLKLAQIDHQFSCRLEPGKKLDVSNTLVTLNDAIALLSIPGEPFIQHQIDLTQQSPVQHSMMLGVCSNGSGSPFVIYLPTIAAAREGGYGANHYTVLEVGAGEKMVASAVAALRAASQ